MTHELMYSVELLCMGMSGLFFSRKNIIAMLIGIELMLLAANFNFIISAYYLDDALGFIFSMITLTMAGVEAALGLSMLVVYYSLSGMITTSFITALKG